MNRLRLASRLALPALLALAAGAQAAEPGRKKGQTTAEITGLAAPPKAKLSSRPSQKSSVDAANAAPPAALPASDAPRKLEYTHESMVIPAKWRMGPKTKDLVRSEYHFQWSPGNMNCSTTVRWAHAAIGTDIAPCWPPDPEFFEFVKETEIDGGAAKLYRRRKGAAGSPTGGAEAIPGGSHMVVNFNANNRCYTMNFQTCEKWVQRFFPDFKFIMENFRVNN